MDSGEALRGDGSSEVTRVSREELLMAIARLTRRRSTCPRKAVGVVIARESRIISTGYNGVASGDPHCSEVSCVLENGVCKRAIHAEMNAIAYAARWGASVAGTTLYTTCCPCLNCAKLIVASGIIRVIWEEMYHNISGYDYLVDHNLVAEAVR
jgi:dCMP deaminase